MNAATSTLMVVLPSTWGTGPTEQAALRAAMRKGGIKRRPPVYLVYQVHPDSALAPSGQIIYPDGHPPRLLRVQPERFTPSTPDLE